MKTILLGLMICVLGGNMAFASAEKQENKKSVETTKVVELKTTKGTIVLELYPDKAPVTVANFLTYANEGFYDGTIFHRVIKSFMIQGGGFTSDMTQKKAAKNIINEANNGLNNSIGTIAMARTSDPHSASSQFFINVVDNSFLDYKSEAQYGYAVFGKVISGLDVIRDIESVATTQKGPYGDVPVEAIEIIYAKEM